MTRILPLDDNSATEVASYLRQASAIVLPTETVYGLAIRPDSEELLRRIYRLKGRPEKLNLPVVVGKIGQLQELGVDFNDDAVALAERFWPGPLTIVMGFREQQDRPRWLEGRIEVAVRFPDHRLLQEIAREVGPFLLTSANAHGTGPRARLLDALNSLCAEVDLAIDAGTLTSTPSTIVNTRLDPPLIERVGAISAAAVADIINNVMIEDMEPAGG